MQRYADTFTLDCYAEYTVTYNPSIALGQIHPKIEQSTGLDHSKKKKSIEQT